MRDLKVFHDNGSYVLLILTTGNYFVQLNFGDDIMSVPTISSTAIIPGLTTTSGFDLVKIDAEWTGFVAAINGLNLARINFGGSLLNDPVVESTFDLSPLDRPFRIKLLNSGYGFYGLITDLGRTTSLVDFGDILSGNYSDLGRSVSNGNSVDGVYVMGKYKFLNLNGTQLESIKFFSNCGIVDHFSELEVPSFSYTSSGEKYIVVRGFDSQDSSVFLTDTITVLSQTAPDISFSTTNQCVSATNTFTPNLSGLSSYSWDIDNDGNPDYTSENPNHQYSNDTSYVIRLDVNDGTCDNFVLDTINIYPDPPQPSFTLDASVFCQEVDVGLSNTTDESGYDDILSYNWTVTDLGSLSEDQPAISFANTGQKNISVTTSLPGCQSSATQQDITVQGAPLSTFSVDDNCLGEESVYDNNSDTGLSYAWTFGDGFGSSLESPTHTYSTAGKFETKLTVTDGIGCASTFSDSVTIFSLPEAGFQNGLICQGDSAIFQDTSVVNNGDIIAWKWYVDSVLVDSVQNPTVFLNQSGTIDLLQVVTGTGECDASTTKSVTVLEILEPSFSIETACLGETYTFTNTTDTSTYLTREWIFQGQTFEQDQVELVLDTAGTYEITLEMMNRNLCSSSFTQSFEVIGAPEFVVQSQNLCANESTIIEDLTSSNDPIISRTWTVGTEVIGNGSQVFYQFGDPGQYNIVLDVITESGCSYQYNQAVSIIDVPDVEFDASSDYAIAGNSIVFTDLSNSDSTFWYVGTDSLGMDSTLTNTFFEEGTVPVSLIAVSEEGCLDTTITNILVAIPQLDLQLLSFEIIEDQSGFGSVIAAVENRSNLPVEDFQFILELDNELTLREQISNRINVGQSGVFNLNTAIPLSSGLVETVCLTVSAGISDDDQTPTDNEFCINLDQKVVIQPPYPNPAQDRLSIKVILPDSDKVTFRLLDMNGKVRFQESFPDVASGLTSFQIPLVDIPPGLYFLEIDAGRRIETSRIVVK